MSHSVVGAEDDTLATWGISRADMPRRRDINGFLSGLRRAGEMSPLREHIANG
jgi:hypothetical protein